MASKPWWSCPMEVLGIILVVLGLAACMGLTGCSYGVRVTVGLHPLPELVVQVGGEGLTPRESNAAPSPPSGLEPGPPPGDGVPLGPETEEGKTTGNARLPPPPLAGPGGPPRMDLR